MALPGTGPNTWAPTAEPTNRTARPDPPPATASRCEANRRSANGLRFARTVRLRRRHPKPAPTNAACAMLPAFRGPNPTASALLETRRFRSAETALRALNWPVQKPPGRQIDPRARRVLVRSPA
jgi:hypothetical protein